MQVFLAFIIFVVLMALCEEINGNFDLCIVMLHAE